MDSAKLFAAAVDTSNYADFDFSQVPGKVIGHSAPISGVYLGSPSFCISPDGTYFASYDIFKDEGAGSTMVVSSTDKGETWENVHFFRQASLGFDFIP